MANKIRTVNTFYALLAYNQNMFYLIGLLVAIQITAGQLLWKFGVDKTGLAPRLALSPYIWGGLALYALATGFNLYALSRYQYSSVQALIIPLGLILAFAAGIKFLGEKPSPLNFVGIAVIIVGVLLATRK